MANIRNLNDSIVEFVNTWNDVVVQKLQEFSTEKEEKKTILLEEKEKKANESPMFAYIYDWLSVGEDENGNPCIKPHKAKKRPDMQYEPTKMRANTHPIGADISDYLCNNKPKGYHNDNSIVGNVNRALPKLVKAKKIEKVNSSYYPTTIEYQRTTMSAELANLTAIDEKCFFSVSKSTYIVYFKETKPGFHKEIEFFKKFFQKNFFDAFQRDNRLIILLRGKLDVCQTLGRLLKKTIEDAYNKQQEANQ